MKKLIPITFILAGSIILATACSAGAGAEPTQMTFATAYPTSTPITLNPTAQPSGNANAGDERTSSVDGMVQIYIPEGSFRMGGMDAWTQPDEQPPHQVTIKAFWMDKTEVTNGMYKLCVQAGACEPPRLLTSATRDTYYNNNDYADFPVILVRWRDANNYCKWAGRRLPFEAEWERAARGNDLRTWPWGDDRPDSSRANFNYNMRDTMKVGSYPSGASPFGVLDLSGNVWEWVSDWYQQLFYENGPTFNPTGPVSPLTGNLKVIRGGSWVDGEFELRVTNRGYTHGGDDKAPINSELYNGTTSNTIGFRCVSDN
jgi:formylglycine-generating enzyme required for sulfatase activity